MSGVITQTDLAAPAQPGFQSPQQAPKTFAADALWQLTPRNVEPPASAVHSDDAHHAHATHAVIVADLDTSASAVSLPNVKAGDDIELALPNGEITRGHVNLVQNDNGVLRLGGSLPDKTNGSFALALDQQSRLMGMILLRDVELAYTIEPGAQRGLSHIEASALSDVICHPYEDPPENPDDAGRAPDSAQAFAAATADAPVALASVPIRSSRPSAPAVLYLDFDGATVTDPYWNSGVTINAAAANLTEAQIEEAWKGVAEAYSPFNIDVTTDPARYAAMPAGKRMRCIITPTYQWYTNSTGTRGVAFRHSFARAGSMFANDTPCWIFVPSWYSYIPLVTAHELGHTLGLMHDGLSASSPRGRQEYFGGHGSGAMSWGPIMGNPSYRNVNQWSKGEYAYASNTEDDLAIITSATNGITYYNDGVGKTRATATTIAIPASGNTTKQGVITTSAHEAWFTFTLSTEKTVSFSAAPNDVVPKLDISMQLQNATGAVLASDNPSLALDALIEKKLSAGKYYIKLKGAAYGDGMHEGYPVYGSAGQYTLIGSTVSAIAAPTITTHPQSKTATTEDASFTLTAAASGGGTLRYQWQKDGVDLVSNAQHPDVTSATLTVLSPTESDAGQYTLKVRNAGGEVTSNAATISIVAPPPPTIATHPQSKTVATTDYSFSLYVNATGAGTLRYQWQKDGVDLVNSSRVSGATGANLYIYTPVASDAGSYTVKITNAGGTTVSNPAIITITLPPPPVITTHPADVTSVAGNSSSISLYVSATGSGSFTYQWLKDGVELQASSHYSGVTSSRLYIYDYTPEHFGRYRVRVSNQGGSVLSNEAVVTITLPSLPVITSHPSNRSATAGDYSAYFYAHASGVGVKYQWMKDGEDLVSSSHYSGATSYYLYVYNPQMTDAGAYAVRVWNAAGSVLSNSGTLTVNMPALPVISNRSAGNMGIVEGETLSLSCNVSSVSNTTYQWYKDGQPVSGAQGTSLSKGDATLADAGVYKLAATNPSGTTWSAEITVTVDPAVAPVFTRQPESQAVYAGRSVTISIAATGLPAPAYQWQKDGASISHTGASMTINDAQSADAGVYTVTATNKAGSATSREALLTVLALNDSEATGIHPMTKEIGPARLVYRVWVRSHTSWTVDADTAAPWISLSPTKGSYNGYLEVTVAPNPIPTARTAVISIAGFRHTLIQKAAGSEVRELWAAGSNTQGQLGMPIPKNVYYYPREIMPNIEAIAAGWEHTLFLKTDGTLWAAGANSYGQLGNGTTTSCAMPVQIATGVRAVAAGENFSFFIKNDNTLWAMGYNAYGQLGTGTKTDYGATPTPIQVAGDVSMVSAGAYHSVFIKTDGTLWAMGYNGSGQFGNGTIVDSLSPVQVASGVTSVATGNYHTLYIKNDGTLWAMGDNGYGQLGNGTTIPRHTPAQITTNVKAVAASGNHSHFVKTDGTLWGMGHNYYGILGDGNAWNNQQTTPVQSAADVQFVAAGSEHCVFIKTDGTLWANGRNSYGLLGDGTATRTTPIMVATRVARVFTGYNNIFFTDNEGATWGVGDNSRGALGVDDIGASQSSTPVHVASNVKSASAGDAHALFVTTDGGLWSMGNNSNGQLGDGGVASRAQPLEIATDARQASAGTSHSLFIKEDDTLWAVGSNYYNQLANQGQASRYTPVQIAANIRTAATSPGGTFYIDTTGTLWAIGSNSLQSLGVDGSNPQAGRVPLPASAGAQAVAPCDGHTLLLKNDGTVWGAGYNSSGHFGAGDLYSTSTFIQVTADGSKIDTAGGYSLLLKTDQTLWAAGADYYGQFGNGHAAYRNTSFVRTATNVRAMAAGSTHSLYIDNDGALWSAGDNAFGQLANGTLVSGSIYARVAANADAVSSGHGFTLFIATGDIRLDPPPPPAITGFSPSAITAQTKVVITGSNFNNLAGVYFGGVEADQYTVDSSTQITAYAPVTPTQDGGHVYVGTFDGVAASAATYSAAYAPVLGDRIEDQYINLGDNLSIEPPALGTPDPTITWQISTNNGTTWTNLAADANHSIDAHGVLKITNAPLSIDGNMYRFTATNIHDTVTSQAFKVVIMYQPVVMAQPASRTVTVGASATFTADIDGVPAPELQWQISTDSGLTWTDIDGATNATHTIAATSAAMNNNQYHLVATNECGSVTTNAASLTVQWAPVQNNPVTSQVGVIGGSVTFSVSIDANPAPASYQWQVSTNGGGAWTNLSNGSTVSGANTASLVLSNATASMNGYRYRCVVSNGIGAALTTAATSLAVIDSIFATPSGLFIASGTLYVSDADAHTIHRVTLSTGKATLFAGAVGQSGTANSTTGTNARFNSPTGLVFTQADKLVYVLDTGNNALRRITTAGGVSRAYHTYDFGDASGITITPADTLFITETQKHTISRIYNTGSGLVLSTISGASGMPGAEDDYGSYARYREPSALAKIPGNSGLVIADTGNHTIRITYYDAEFGSPPYFYTYTIAGLTGQAGSLDGSGTAARFNRPAGIAASANHIYVADTGNHTIRRADNYGSVTTLAGMAGQAGYSNGTGTSARFNKPTALALDSTYQNLYIADSNNSVIRKLNLATNEVTTLMVSATDAPVSPPVITKHPQNITATQGVGGPLTLTFTATGAGALTSVWQKDGGNITASNHYVIDANSLKIYNHTTTDSGQYRVIVSNEGGSVTSNPATVTVNPSTSGTNTGGNSGNNSDSGGGGGGGAPSLWLLVALGVLVAMRGRWRL
ncbi:immunoglobulin domain-containing protein [Ereboglobus sp. PH5-5]|uniref:immunoglobulin domain-containing protein n=1 Tax=Ereboglobus sp. PH5-5 TaxID=2940529 RepID=UPI002405D6B5|nr:immunoglobulin domain-containing protein [Ereboglobus sp. PH5-5]